jgi:hypothetical protein
MQERRLFNEFDYVHGLNPLTSSSDAFEIARPGAL